MTDFEKLIYNKHLAITRSCLGKPFKLRQDFSKLDESSKLAVKKLSHFFSKHDNISLDKFFKAPFIIYKDKSHYPLDFYLGMKAVKLYREYINKLNRESPDSEDSIQMFKQSLKFVINYCRDKEIKFSEYISYGEGNIQSFFEHLKHGKVSLLFLMTFSNFENELKKIDNELRQHLLGDSYSIISQTRVKFYNCKQSTKDLFNHLISKTSSVMG